MGTTNMLLREILQEIRDVKTHGIPASTGGQLSARNFTSLLTTASESDRARIASLFGAVSSKKATTKKVVEDLYFSEELDAFISRDGSVYFSDVDDTTLEPVARIEKRIGTIRPGVRPENATAADFEICPEDGPSAGGGLNEQQNKRLSCRMSKDEIARLSKEDKKRRNELKKMASEERKASRLPEEQAKINARVAAMQAGRAKSNAAGGGGMGVADFTRMMADISKEEKEQILSLLKPAKASAEERQTRKRKNYRNRTRKNQK